MRDLGVGPDPDGRLQRGESRRTGVSITAFTTSLSVEVGKKGNKIVLTAPCNKKTNLLSSKVNVEPPL